MDYPALDSREECALQDIATLTGEQVRELIIAVRRRGIEKEEGASDELEPLVNE